MSTNFESGSAIVIIGTPWSTFFLYLHAPGPLLGRDIPPGKCYLMFCYLFSLSIFFSCNQGCLLFLVAEVIDIAIALGTMSIANFFVDWVVMNRLEVCQRINSE